MRFGMTDSPLTIPRNRSQPIATVKCDICETESKVMCDGHFPRCEGTGECRGLLLLPAMPAGKKYIRHMCEEGENSFDAVDQRDREYNCPRCKQDLVVGPVTEFRCKQKVYWAYPAIPWEIQLKQTNEEHEERMDMLTHDLEMMKLERDDCRERVWAITRAQRVKAAANKQRQDEEEVRKRELVTAKELIEELKEKMDEQKEEVKYLRTANAKLTDSVLNLTVTVSKMPETPKAAAVEVKQEVEKIEVIKEVEKIESSYDSEISEKKDMTDEEFEKISDELDESVSQIAKNEEVAQAMKEEAKNVQDSTLLFELPQETNRPQKNAEFRDEMLNRYLMDMEMRAKDVDQKKLEREAMTAKEVQKELVEQQQNEDAVKASQESQKESKIDGIIRRMQVSVNKLDQTMTENPDVVFSFFGQNPDILEKAMNQVRDLDSELFKPYCDSITGPKPSTASEETNKKNARKATISEIHKRMSDKLKELNEQRKRQN